MDARWKIWEISQIVFWAGPAPSLLVLFLEDGTWIDRTKTVKSLKDLLNPIWKSIYLQMY